MALLLCYCLGWLLLTAAISDGQGFAADVSGDEFRKRQALCWPNKSAQPHSTRPWNDSFDSLAQCKQQAALEIAVSSKEATKEEAKAGKQAKVENRKDRKVRGVRKVRKEAEHGCFDRLKYRNTWYLYRHFKEVYQMLPPVFPPMLYFDLCDLCDFPIFSSIFSIFSNFPHFPIYPSFWPHFVSIFDPIFLHLSIILLHLSIFLLHSPLFFSIFPDLCIFSPFSPLSFAKNPLRVQKTPLWAAIYPPKIPSIRYLHFSCFSDVSDFPIFCHVWNFFFPGLEAISSNFRVSSNVCGTQSVNSASFSHLLTWLSSLVPLSSCWLVSWLLLQTRGVCHLLCHFSHGHSQTSQLLCIWKAVVFAL